MLPNVSLLLLMSSAPNLRVNASELIIKLPKKGDISDCNNWRDITLLSIVRNASNRMLSSKMRDQSTYLLEKNRQGFAMAEAAQT